VCIPGAWPQLLAAGAEFDPATGTPANADAERLCALRWQTGAADGVREVAYAELEKATGGFSAAHELGGGGSCTVYRGRLCGLSVAIKALKPVVTPFATKQYEAEMRLLCAVTHRSICRLYAHCSRGGPRRCLVLELCRGGTLEQRIACKPGPAAGGAGTDGADGADGADGGAGAPLEPLTWQHRLQLAVEMADALLHLHTLTPQVLHRDFKSANVLLDDGGHAKVADFGLAHAGVVADATKSHVSTVNRAGTSMYMPMEYLQRGHVSAKTDSFAFGIVLLELLTGRRPIEASELYTMEPDLFQELQTRYLDARGGKWPAAVLREVAAVAQHCLAISPMLCCRFGPRSSTCPQKSSACLAIVAAIDRKDCGSVHV
jgi:serine/threonine protein kinase